MKNETLKKISELLESFNQTFQLDANLVDDDKDTDSLSAELKISNIKNDGANFISILHETFNAIVENVSEEHEVMYIKDKGMCVVKKVVTTKYVIEQFGE